MSRTRQRRAAIARQCSANDSSGSRARRDSGHRRRTVRQHRWRSTRRSDAGLSCPGCERHRQFSRRHQRSDRGRGSELTPRRMARLTDIWWTQRSPLRLAGDVQSGINLHQRRPIHARRPAQSSGLDVRSPNRHGAVCSRATCWHPSSTDQSQNAAVRPRPTSQPRDHPRDAVGHRRQGRSCASPSL